MSTPTTSSEGGRSLEDAYERELTWAFQLTEAGQDEQAMQILTRLLAGYPDNAGLTYTVLAVTHSAAGRLEESEAMARRAIAAAPDYSEAHRLLAQALIYQGKEPEAEHSLRTALELSPEDVSLFSLMATALTRMGRTEEALLYAHEAVRLSPESADSHAALAAAQRTADPEAAKASLHEALRLDPLCEEALLLQFQILDRRTRPRAAAKALAAYTAHTSVHAMARIAVSSFLLKFLSVAHFGMLGCMLLTTILLALVRTSDLPSEFLLLPLFLTAGLTCWATLARIRAFRLYFAGRCWRLLRACIRHHRYLALWGAAVPVIWLILVIGVIRAIQGDDAILSSTLSISIVHLVLGWGGSLLVPFIQRRNT